MADRTDHPIHSRPGQTRRTFLEAGALTLLGLAASPLARPAAAQTPEARRHARRRRRRQSARARPAEVRGRPQLDDRGARLLEPAAPRPQDEHRRRPGRILAGGQRHDVRLQAPEGRHWHHGRDLVADDVKYSFERMLDEKTASPWRSNWQIIDRIETPDRSTVRFVLKRPFAPFFSYLATPHYSAIVPRDLVEKHGDLQKNASGTGPFMLDRFVPDNTVVLKRNPSVLRGGPALSRRHRVPDHPGRGRPRGRAACGHRPLPLVRRSPHRPAGPGRLRRRAP